VVIVADRGPGLKADELERVFEQVLPRTDLLRPRDWAWRFCRRRSSTRMAAHLGGEQKGEEARIFQFTLPLSLTRPPVALSLREREGVRHSYGH